MTLALESIAVPLRLDSDGVVRVGSSRVTLDTIVLAFEQGAAAEQIAKQYPAVTLAEVYATVAFFLTHEDAVRSYLKARQAVAAQLRRELEARQDPSGIRQRLSARRQNPS